MNRRHAYTLVEMLVVIGVIAALIALAMPVLTSVTEGTALTRGGTALADQLILGRQLAFSRAAEIQVRFVWLEDEVRGVQLWGASASDTTQFVPLTRITRLPDGLAVAETEALSPLLFGSDSGDAPTIPQSTDHFGGLGELKYCGFRFNGSGGTDLPLTSTSNFLTVVSSRDKHRSSLPQNYYTIQIDPVNGKVKSYRP